MWSCVRNSLKGMKKVVWNCCFSVWLLPDQDLPLSPSLYLPGMFGPASTKQLGKMSNKKTPCEPSSLRQPKFRDFHINRIRTQCARLASFVFRWFIRGYALLSVRLLSQLALWGRKGPPFLFSSFCCHLFLLLWKEACHTMRSFSTLAALPASHFSLFKSVYTVSLAT